MKIGIYVGSFDPVHKGHIKVVNHLLKESFIDKIIIIPTLGYWNKNNQIELKHRINMLKYYETPNIIIDTKNNNYKYTSQILNKIKKEYKDDQLYLIIGDDLLKDFHKWNNVEEILNNNILVIKRKYKNIEKIIDKSLNINKFIAVEKVDNQNISSTLIRKKIKHQENITNYIDKNVLDYIRENNLYQQ